MKFTNTILFATLLILASSFTVAKVFPKVDLKDLKGNKVKTESFIDNKKVTKPANKPKSYAFCSDTAYSEAIIPIIKEADVLYHESTFLEKNESLTAPTKHSTAKQAATIAKKANVGTLILGHYSTRYDGLKEFKEEANTIFKNVKLAEDGKFFEF